MQVPFCPFWAFHNECCVYRCRYGCSAVKVALTYVFTLWPRACCEDADDHSGHFAKKTTSMSDAGGTSRRSAGSAGTRGPASSGGNNPTRQPRGPAPGNPGVQINRVSVDELRKKLSKVKSMYLDFDPNVRVRVEPLETGEDFFEVNLEYIRATVALPRRWYSTLELSLRYLPTMRRQLDIERMSSRSEKRLGFEMTLNDVTSLDKSSEEYRLLSMSNKEFDSWFASQKQTQRPQRPPQAGSIRSQGRPNAYSTEQYSAARVMGGGVSLFPPSQFNWADEANSVASTTAVRPAAGPSSLPQNEGQNAVSNEAAGSHSGTRPQFAVSPSLGESAGIDPAVPVSRPESHDSGHGKSGASVAPSLPPPSGKPRERPLPPPSTRLPGPGSTAS